MRGLTERPSHRCRLIAAMSSAVSDRTLLLVSP
jgi:hypothetical protein